MRSGVIPEFAKVEGHTALIRDMTSNAIIYNDDNEYNAYKRKSEIAKKNLKMIEENNIEIDALKSDIIEIKQMLSQLLIRK